MKKAERQALILDILGAGGGAGTQEEIVDGLQARGVYITQATVSRDVKELKLHKFVSGDGTYRYAEPSAQEERAAPDRLRSVFSESCVKVAYSANIVVVGTQIGMAPACALAIDAAAWSEVVGTLAGDDTVLVVARSAPASRRLVGRIRALMGDEQC
ncbi:MAG: arginine repressor [Clostridiales bacterium]|nr:arginine repressor [Clostridiales bacterium]